MNRFPDMGQKLPASHVSRGRRQGRPGRPLRPHRYFPELLKPIYSFPTKKAPGSREEFLKHSRFTLDGEQFMAMDSSFPHGFTFNEAVSFVVTCDTQEQIDYYSGKLSAHPEAEQCGWIKDRYGVSWQIVPARHEEDTDSGNPKDSPGRCGLP